MGSNYYGKLGIDLKMTRVEPFRIPLGAPVVQSLVVPVGANLGGTALLTVKVAGIAPYTYQWRKNGIPIAGATGEGYFIGTVTAASGGAYDVVVTGSRGSTISSAGTLTVLNAPPVIDSPLSAVVDAESNGYRITANNDAFQFSATGLPAGLAINAATGLVSGTPTSPAGHYAVTITATNAHGSDQAVLDLEVSYPPGFPVITQQPQPQSAVLALPATFTVSVTGDPVPACQWQRNGLDIPGATNPSFTIASVRPTDAGAYTVKVSNTAGLVFSAPAILTVLPRPVNFDATAYLAHNPDVAAAIGDQPDAADQAWAHYCQLGILEGRTDGDFNAQAYRAQYPESGATLQGAAVHWYTIGRRDGLRIPAGFDVTGYFARNLDIAAYFANDKYGAWLHYYNYGVYEGRSFDANFIAAEYLELNQDLKAAIGAGNLKEAVMHWLTWGHTMEDRMGRVPIGFNVDNYLVRYPDLAAGFGGITPVAVRNVAVWQHFLDYGAAEGRSDGDFDIYTYLAENPDVAVSVSNNPRSAALHWFFYGRREGRRIPGGFNVHNYRTLYPDLVVFSGDDLYGCWLHYRDTGVTEGRIYDDTFRPSDYLALNPDIAAVIGATNYRDALLHWLYYGQYEGRQGKF
jgi:hypothetical protein